MIGLLEMGDKMYLFNTMHMNLFFLFGVLFHAISSSWALVGAKLNLGINVLVEVL